MPGLRLTEYERNVHSQSGEDGVIEKLLGLLPAASRWSVEFGAWDGKHLSNTWNLLANRGYSGVLIEADRARYDVLVANTASMPVTPVCAFVGFDEHDNLDVILGKTKAPIDLDVLSIDVDGNDYHIWKACRLYRPKIVVIEFNPTIANEVDFVQARDPAAMHGASAKSLVALGHEKGYELVAVTRFNCIFVLAELFGALGIEDNSLATLRTDVSLVSHIFCGYDGTVFITGSGRMPWHGMRYDEIVAQQLPAFLRQMPPYHSRAQRAAFRLLSLGRRVRKRLVG